MAWWVFMRISGVALVFLVLGHIYMTFLMASEKDTQVFDVVVNKLSQPVWKLYDLLILALALLHGVNGARYSIEDYIRNKPDRFWVKAVFYSVVALIFVFGALGLFIISPEMLRD
nr:succinate dehydrogenase [Deinobacterium chartae]